jgi:cytochrome P450
VAQAFGRGHIERLRPRVAELAETLLDGCADALAANGSFDALAHYAEPLPVLVIAELLGWPEADRPLLRPWSQAIVKMYELDRTPEQEAAAQRAAAEFAAYVTELAAERRASPRADLVTHLVQVRDGSDRLDEHELVATVVLLLNAGTRRASTASATGWCRCSRRRTSSTWCGATSLTRHWSRSPPRDAAPRLAAAPVRAHGHGRRRGGYASGPLSCRPGTRWLPCSGRPTATPRCSLTPTGSSPTAAPTRTLRSAQGIHFCLGAPLARLELQASLPALLRRFPSLQLAAAPVRRPTFVLRGYQTLPVTA